MLDFLDEGLNNPPIQHKGKQPGETWLFNSARSDGTAPSPSYSMGLQPVARQVVILCGPRLH
jgi:hypothetical protein